MSDYGLIINGKKVFSSNTFSVLNPANEEVIAECPIASKGQLDEAVSAASIAFKTWSAEPDNIKAEACGNISAAITELESEKDLKNSIIKYQRLIQLNNFIENKFKEKSKSITSKTLKILSKIQKK